MSQVYWIDVGRSPPSLTSGFNDGFDNENGDYLHLEVGDHIGYRFEIIDKLGKGSFGQVAKVKDHKTGVVSALKIIRNKKRFHK